MKSRKVDAAGFASSDERIYNRLRKRQKAARAYAQENLLQ